MELFENYGRRIENINKVLEENNIKDLEEARNLCIENIDEDKLITGICKGYVSGISENCNFFTDNQLPQW